MENQLAHSPLSKMSSDQDITVLLDKLAGGNKNVVDELLPQVYDQLKVLARSQLSGERNNHTLNTTALVHEAYVKLVGQNEVAWKNRSHFFGVASLAMRRILINYANQRMAQKRGGDAVVATFDDELMIADLTRAEHLIRLDEALKRLEKINKRASDVVTMRYFAGLTQVEIAEALGLSEITIRRDWRFAKAWLARDLSGNDTSSSSE